MSLVIEGIMSREPMTEREKLMPHKFALFAVGVTHTLLCAGTVYGWSSLEAILR